MDILVCFKIVPALDEVPQNNWIFEEPGGIRVDTRFVRTTINPYDENALELGLKLAEQMRGAALAARLSALTIGGGAAADRALKTLRALRFDETIRVATQTDLRFIPDWVAAVIAAFIRERSAHPVLILGRQSGEGDNGKTPYLLAERLRWPCISEAVRARPLGGGELEVASTTDDGLLVQTIAPPCVLAVGDIAGCALRSPTLKDRMRFGNQPITTLDAKDLAVDPVDADRAPPKMTVIRHERSGTILDGADAATVARRLYNDYIRPRLNAL